MNILERWKCEACGELHETEDGAIGCCPPSVHFVFLCGECKAEHDSQHEAEECCRIYEIDPPTAEELEAQGQARLIP